MTYQSVIKIATGESEQAATPPTDSVDDAAAVAAASIAVSAKAPRELHPAPRRLVSGSRRRGASSAAVGAKAPRQLQEAFARPPCGNRRSAAAQLMLSCR